MLGLVGFYILLRCLKNPIVSIIPINIFKSQKKVTIKKYREERKMRVELKKGENPSRSLSEFFDITFWVKKLWHKIYRITLSEPVLCFLPPKYV